MLWILNSSIFNVHGPAVIVMPKKPSGHVPEHYKHNLFLITIHSLRFSVSQFISFINPGWPKRVNLGLHCKTKIFYSIQFKHFSQKQKRSKLSQNKAKAQDFFFLTSWQFCYVSTIVLASLCDTAILVFGKAHRGQNEGPD